MRRFSSKEVRKSIVRAGRPADSVLIKTLPAAQGTGGTVPIIPFTSFPGEELRRALLEVCADPETNVDSRFYRVVSP